MYKKTFIFIYKIDIKQMKSLSQYILEAKKSKERDDIKFTIWEAPDKKVKWLNNNTDYLKIEYQYKNKKLGIEIDFLLGFKENTWKLWIGKIGSISYDDDPWVNLDCDNFFFFLVLTILLIISSISLRSLIDICCIIIYHLIIYILTTMRTIFKVIIFINFITTCWTNIIIVII